jgi:hypothetical protein
MEVQARMRERHLLDTLKDGTFWTNFTRHVGPPSGAGLKLARADQRYVFTTFGYGCNLGPVQAASHAPATASADTLRGLNAQHINTSKLEAAMTDLIDATIAFPCRKFGRWPCGDRRWHAHSASGKQPPRRPAYPLRCLWWRRLSPYRGHYIALFIPCGPWETVHILHGIMKNRSTIQPDILHADTQGQSEPVFGLPAFLASC